MTKSMMAVLGVAAFAGAASAQVFPTTGHAAQNFIPFGAGTVGGIPTMHQVFDDVLFGTDPVEITSIGFSPGTAGVFNLGQVTISMGYSSAPPLALGIPVQGGGGAPNAAGPMSVFYDAPTVFTIGAAGNENFTEMRFNGSFVYDPGQGDLLIEIVIPDPNNLTMTVSRAAASGESTRAYSGMRFADNANINASRFDFALQPAGGGCDPDLTTGAIAGQPGYGVPNGVLNNDDFFYYLALFAANDPAADLTTGAIAGQPGYGVPNGIINNDDFFYYLALFAAGC
ncbi:MAG: GC-type dockerin domain-anchored protein [Phycisphaerales bacterium]